MAIGSRQPEEKREHAGFDAEGRHKEEGNHRHQFPGLMGKHFLVQMGHVQSACQTIEQSQTHEEQKRRQQVDHHVGDRPRKLGRPLAPRHETKRGHQHDLEPDIEIEEVAGQKGPTETAEQDMEKGVKTFSAQMGRQLPARVKRRCRSQDAGDH